MKKGNCVEVNGKIVEKAKELGLDLPKFIERALIRGIEALEQSESEKLLLDKNSS